MKRLVIKADWKSTTAAGVPGGTRVVEHRGCILTLEHLRNPMAMRILEVAVETCEWDEVVCSEGWRDIRDEPDAHERSESFDFSLGEHGPVVGNAWASRMQAVLGSNYYVICHGPIWHVHAQISKSYRL